MPPLPPSYTGAVYTLLIVIDVKLRLNFRSYHRHSPRAKDPRRRVRIHRYWNEDFLVAVQFSKRQFNDLYVWRWKECQQPEFMYNKGRLEYVVKSKNNFCLRVFNSLGFPIKFI